MRHIALYIGSLQMGGAERVMVNLAEALFARGWRVTFVTTYAAKEEYDVPHGSWQILRGNGGRNDRKTVEALTPEEETVRVEFARAAPQDCFGVSGDEHVIGRVFSGVASRKGDGRPAVFRRRIKKLRSIWRQLAPDVILSFIGKNNCMALLSARGCRVPVVVSVRATPVVEYPTAVMRFAAAALFPKAAAVSVQSSAAAAWFPPRTRRRAVVVPNAVAREFLTEDSEEPHAREKTIVAVGRLDANKNIGMLLRAFARLLRKGAEEGIAAYRIVLYGDGEMRGELAAQAQVLGIAERVHFMGRQRGIAEKIRHAGIFCLTSDREGMPNTLIEAMCLGLPCIATDCVYGGVDQFVRDGENALVISPGDEDALMDALARLAADPALAETLGRNAKKLRDDYAPNRVTDIWEQLLVRAAESGR